ncbi:MAG: hypothetical protein K8S55_12685 [Phycisphaerae bacterium]|nr:hypothetical protein [Phycisphaerae bacterium]
MVLMSDNENHSASSSTVSGQVICLYVLAILSALGGIVLAMRCVLQGPGPAASPADVWLQGFGFLFGGFGAAVVFWVVSLFLSRQRELLRVLQHLMRLFAEKPMPTAPQAQPSRDDAKPAAPPPVPPPDLNEEILSRILMQLEELNRNLLLSPDQREAMLQERQNRLVEEGTRLAEAALAEGNFELAEEVINRRCLDIPGDSRLTELRQRIRCGRDEQQQALIANQSQRAADLMSVARFDEAVKLAEQLQQQYPESSDAGHLLDRVQREADTYQGEQRRRLYAIVHEHAETRQWTDALAAAHRLTETYPESPEATKVHTLMPTLVDNTRIQEVRQFRDRIVDMMDRRRYTEAVDLARHVVENYPETAAAEELRAQMPQLTELAKRNQTQ